MRIASFGFVAVLLSTLVGCNSSKVEVVDLNKVLDVLAATLSELDAQKTDQGEVELAEVKPEEENAADRQKFLDLYAKNLNEADLLSGAIGVEMAAAGDVKGFSDANTNNRRDAGEKDLFKVQIDAENSRLIASDDANHHRDYHYRPGGFFTGYLIGSMLGRSRSYYSGPRSSMKPDFSKTKMSPKSYHASAVSKARARARSTSARSRSGSRGTSFGK